jgi:hypothetical protein
MQVGVADKINVILQMNNGMIQNMIYLEMQCSVYDMQSSFCCFSSFKTLI